jgi:hypothetical protein
MLVAEGTLTFAAFGSGTDRFTFRRRRVDGTVDLRTGSFAARRDVALTKLAVGGVSPERADECFLAAIRPGPKAAAGTADHTARANGEAATAPLSKTTRAGVEAAAATLGDAATAPLGDAAFADAATAPQRHAARADATTAPLGKAALTDAAAGATFTTAITSSATATRSQERAHCQSTNDRQPSCHQTK